MTGLHAANKISESFLLDAVFDPFNIRLYYELKKTYMRMVIMMSRVINLTDVIAEKKVSQIKQSCEREFEREQILRDVPTNLKTRGLDLSEAIKKLEYKLAEYEESFYNFTKNNVRKEDTFVFTAFLFSHMRNFVDALSIDESGEEIVICIDYLKNLSERAARTYVSDLME